MTDSALHAVTQLDAGTTDLLHELLRKGARDLIAKAVEVALNTFLEQASKNESVSEIRTEWSNCLDVP